MTRVLDPVRWGDHQLVIFQDGAGNWETRELIRVEALAPCQWSLVAQISIPAGITLDAASIHARIGCGSAVLDADIVPFTAAPPFVGARVLAGLNAGIPAQWISATLRGHVSAGVLSAALPLTCVLIAAPVMPFRESSVDHVRANRVRGQLQNWDPLVEGYDRTGDEF